MLGRRGPSDGVVDGGDWSLEGFVVTVGSLGFYISKRFDAMGIVGLDSVV